MNDRPRYPYDVFERESSDWGSAPLPDPPVAPGAASREVAPEVVDVRGRIQWGCLALAMVWIVVGGIALARISVGGGQVEVLGLGFTAAGAVIACGLGGLLALLGAGTARDGSGLLVVGILVAAPGFVVAAVPEAFADSIGATTASGIALIATGVLLAAFAQVLRAHDRRSWPTP